MALARLQVLPTEHPGSLMASLPLQVHAATRCTTVKAFMDSALSSSHGIAMRPVFPHDELDLAPGRVKCKTGGGHAGHNGLRSIHAHIGAEYDRVRMGIGHPGHKDAVAGYVLRDFPKADEGWLDDVLRGVSDGAADLARGDTGRFMNAVALRVAPPRSGTGSKGPKKPAEAQPKPAPSKPVPSKPEPEAEAQSPLQKLMHRFR